MIGSGFIIAQIILGKWINLNFRVMFWVSLLLQ